MSEEATAKVSIIMPFYDRWDLVHARMYEFYKFLPDYCEICLVNDASTEEAARTGVGFWQGGASRHKVRYRENKENLGFGSAMNAGAKIAKGEILVFYSDDVIMKGNCISSLVEVFEREEKDKILVGDRLIYWPAGWNEFDVNGKKIIIPYLEGYLLSCTRPAWEELGGFDLAYGKHDYEDVDLSTKALSLDYNLVALQSPLLLHIMSGTIKPEGRMEITRRNREIYFQKWQSFLQEYGKK